MIKDLYKKSGKKALVVAALLLANQMISVAQAPVQITTTAVPFLQLTPDARSGGMGNMGVATSADIDGIFHNQSKSVFMQDSAGISANYMPYLKNVTSGISLTSLAGFYKLDDKQMVSASLRYFSVGDVQVTDYSGSKLGTYRPNEFAFDLGYSRLLSKKISIGLTARYIYSKLADGSVNGVTYTAGNAFAADISMYYNGINEEGEGLTAGFALSNLGSKMSYTDNNDAKAFLPANAGIGVAYTKKFEGPNKLMFGVEGNKLLVPAVPYTEEEMKDYNNMGIMQSWTKSFSNDAYVLSAGAEYSYNDVFNLRAGYFYEGEQQGNRQFATAGVGLKYQAFDFNFSYLFPTGMSKTESATANTLRFGVAYHISNNNKK